MLVTSVVTVLSRGDGESLAVGTPERAVQDYLIAIDEGDYATAYGLLTPDLQSNCSRPEFERSIYRRETSPRVRLDEVTRTSTGAEVTVRITETYSAQPIPSESSFTQRFLLEEVGGLWKLSAPSWPTPACP